jgi:hypothetical protein
MIEMLFKTELPFIEYSSILEYFMFPETNFRDKFKVQTLINQKAMKRLEQKSSAGCFDNVLEAYYQETAIRKRRFELQEVITKTPCSSTDTQSLFANLTMVSCPK